jgi:uncharacterized protein (DUF885 family)
MNTKSKGEEMKKYLLISMALVAVLNAKSDLANNETNTNIGMGEEQLVLKYTQDIKAKQKKEAESKKIDEMYYIAMKEAEDTLKTIQEILDMIENEPKYVTKAQINLLKQDLQKLKQIQKRFPDSGRIKRDIETIKEVLKSIEGGK